MKINIENLKDTFDIGYNAYIDSRKEANEVEDQYHNRHYTDDQVAVLENRGQPKETFNVVKLFSRQLVGYYSTIINTIKVNPVQYNDIEIASLLNDTAHHELLRNDFESEGDKAKLDGFLSGLLCSYINIKETGETDEFGRKLYKIDIEHVPSSELVLDPMSTKSDYSDARYIHRFKWLPEETIKSMFKPSSVDKVDEYYNFLNIDEAEFEFRYNEKFEGTYRQHNNYLIVHTIMEDDNGKTFSIYWCGDTILDKKEITYKEVKNPYRVVKLSDSNKIEYYGVFREVIESQKAINQALIQIQLMVNSDKAFVEDGAVENLEEFTVAFNRVNTVIPVNHLGGIRVENMSGDIQQQYIIIDKAFDRIQRILGINDSFLGMAYASDSGRKVKLQANAAMVALRYITKKLELFYKLVGTDIVNLIKQYYTANQVLRVADESVGARWVELNRPIMLPNQFTGIEEPVFDEMLNPETGEPETDDNGNILYVPLNDSRTDISFTEFDIEITTNAYNDEDEKNQLMLETMLSGNIGNALMTVNPAGFMKAASLSVKSMKAKHSHDIANILEQTAGMLQPQPEMQAQLGMGNPSSQQPMSAGLKLPQNTNEGAQ